MPTNLKTLIELYEGKGLDIKYDSEREQYNERGIYPTTAVIAEQVPLDVKQATQFCYNLGWSDDPRYMNCHPFRLIDKTRKFIKGIKNHIPESLWDTTFILFENRKAGGGRWEQYGSTTDRIVITNTRKTKPFWFTVLYGASNKSWGSTTRYEVFDGKTSNKLKNCASLKQVGEYISSYE